MVKLPVSTATRFLSNPFISLQMNASSFWGRKGGGGSGVMSRWAGGRQDHQQHTLQWRMLVEELTENMDPPTRPPHWGVTVTVVVHSTWWLEITPSNS